jgi:hypothetical protein
MMELRRIEFYGLLGKVGHLDWQDGTLVFEGELDQSAEAFLDSLNKVLSEKLHQAYLNGWNDALKEKIN